MRYADLHGSRLDRRLAVRDIYTMILTPNGIAHRMALNLGKRFLGAEQGPNRLLRPQSLLPRFSDNLRRHCRDAAYQFHHQKQKLHAVFFALYRFVERIPDSLRTGLCSQSSSWSESGLTIPLPRLAEARGLGDQGTLTLPHLLPDGYCVQNPPWVSLCSPKWLACALKGTGNYILCANHFSLDIMITNN